MSSTNELTILSGAIFIDKNGERFFISTRADTRAAFGSQVVEGNQVLRVINDADPGIFFPMVGHATQAVSVASRLATEPEMRRHDQVTDPTIVAEKIVQQETIRQRAFHLFQSGADGTALDHWTRAERELLGIRG